MALSTEALAYRVGKLGGSDIGKIVNGTNEDIIKLWKEKMGDLAPEDISDNWPVYRGTHSEQPHLNWQERKNRMEITRRGDTISHYRYDWAFCTLDGWLDALECPIEVKDVGGREPLDPVLLDRYAPQLQWTMEMTGADVCALSVIIAAEAPVMQFVDRDKAYAKLLIERGAIFIEHVRNRTPPVELPAIPAPINATKNYDMQGNNEFAHHADIWLQLRDSAAAYDDAAKILKSLVPPDAKRCFGYGVQITRSSAGYLSLREKAA